MRRWQVSLALAGLAAIWCAPSGAAQTPQARARQAADWVCARDYAPLVAASTPDMQKAMPIEAWNSKVTPLLAGFGKLIEFGQPSSEPMQGNTAVTLPARFEKARMEFTVSVTASGQIAGLFIHPPKAAEAPYSPAAYSVAAAFAERDATIGDDEWKLPGTLLCPKSAHPVPAVVLVHGSGPNDRDETLMGNKPFRDLAEGLASKGIAVLRYDKRTKVYGAKMAGMKTLTVREETVEDAARAVQLLRRQPEVDPKRVFVVGHSLGGYLLPRILQHCQAAAGGIAMAGSTRPLEDLVLEQFEYLVPIQTAQSEEAQRQGQKILEDTRRNVAAIKALQPGGPDGEKLMGAYPAYWLDLRGYNPPAEAAKLRVPLLILQGERDYQVSMQDFANWKASLGGREDVVLRSYPTLNHLFMEGKGKSTPAEYAKPGHVSAKVVDDIAAWLLAR